MDTYALIKNYYIHALSHVCYIREYSSALYVGLAWKKNGHPYISYTGGKLKSLLMYTDKLKYTYNL